MLLIDTSLSCDLILASTFGSLGKQEHTLILVYSCQYSNGILRSHLHPVSVQIHAQTTHHPHISNTHMLWAKRRKETEFSSLLV